VQLGQIIAHYDLNDIANQFYDRAYNRWMEGIEASEKRLGSIHMPIEKWRKISEGSNDV
jgi:hypothetical protein